MELYTWPCASHDISDRWLPRVSGGVIGNDHDKRSLQTRWSLVRSAYEGKVRQTKKCFSLNLTYVVAFLRLNRRFGPTFGVRNSHFSGGRIFKNAVRTVESANWRDWNCVSAVFRWSLLSGGRKDRFDCISRPLTKGQTNSVQNLVDVFIQNDVRKRASTTYAYAFERFVFILYKSPGNCTTKQDAYKCRVPQSSSAAGKLRNDKTCLSMTKRVFLHPLWSLIYDVRYVNIFMKVVLTTSMTPYENVVLYWVWFGPNSVLFLFVLKKCPPPVATRSRHCSW